MSESAVAGTEPSFVRKIYLSGPSKTKTFQYDDTLPSLPVPDLGQTVQKYLRSIEPLVSPEQYNKTKALAHTFEKGEGTVLQKKLLERASKQKNWLADWWLKYAYLSGRSPLAPSTNMAGVQSLHFTTWEPKQETALEQASLCLWSVLDFFVNLRKEKIRPHASKNGDKQTMNQFRYFFNTSRIPKEGSDEIVSYFKTESEGPCPLHMLVSCLGHIWVMEPFLSEDDRLTVPELESQLKYILQLSEALGEGQGVGTLTFDNRELWAKNRRWLSSLSEENARNLHIIDSALLLYTLDENSPKDVAEACQLCLAGDPKSRWADKSHGAITFKNGFHGTSNDHSPYDAMVNVSVGHYQHGIIQDEFGGVWTGSKETQRGRARRPRRLLFNLDHILDASIERIRKENRALNQTTMADLRVFDIFGKNWIREKKVHPDAYVQCALQLAYYQLHHKLAPTYETATTRQFYNARTETVRSCTSEMVDFVKAMQTDTCSKNEKRGKLLLALNRHVELMKECQNGQGVDRHLMGLALVAAESGMPTPQIFKDPSFELSGGNGNFVLSTSTVGYTYVLGGVAAMVKDGYGIFYVLLPDRIHFFLTCYSGGETCLKKFFQSLTQALIYMQEVISGPQSRL